MDAQCMSLIDDITSKYIIRDLDKFLSITPDHIKHNRPYRSFSFNVYNKEFPDKNICYASIILFRPAGISNRHFFKVKLSV